MNAIIGACHSRLADAHELDETTARLYDIERKVHPDGRDNLPDPDGNYPVDALILVLRRRRLRACFVPRAETLLVHPNSIAAMRALGADAVVNTVGFLVGTGTHYVAVARNPAID